MCRLKLVRVKFFFKQDANNTTFGDNNEKLQQLTDEKNAYQNVSDSKTRKLRLLLMTKFTLKISTTDYKKHTMADMFINMIQQ